jgi:hypothetical protein
MELESTSSAKDSHANSHGMSEVGCTFIRARVRSRTPLSVNEHAVEMLVFDNAYALQDCEVQSRVSLGFDLTRRHASLQDSA